MVDFIKKYPVWSVLAFSFLCFLPILIMRDFSPSNELRYLSIADEALRDGHFFAFFNHGLVYADKPPLYFWIIMLCKTIFGCHSMFALTFFFSFVPACIIVLAMDRWTLSDADPLTRAAAAMMMMSTAMFLSIAIFLRMDMLMCMFIVLAMYAFARGKRWLFALYCFLALFTKGPLGVLVPVVAVVVYLIAERRAREILRWLGWRFWLVLAAGCALWFTGVYLDGGKTYLDNLVLHQTVDRAVNSFDHKAPFWHYLTLIWGVVAPWCLVTVPACCLYLGRKQTGKDAEKICVWTVVSAFVLLSCFSSKLAIYLAPIFPFLNYAFPKAMERREWRGWWKIGLAVPCVLLAIIGFASIITVIFFDTITPMAQFSFAHCAAFAVYGAILLGASIAALRLLRDGWRRPVLIVGASLLILFPFGSTRMQQINDFVGYRNICSAVPEDTEVYTLKVRRAENMDVFLGRDVHILPPDTELSETTIPEGSALITKKDYRSQYLEDWTPATFGGYTLWLK